MVSLVLLWRYLPETMHLPLEGVSALFEDPYPLSIHGRTKVNEASLLVDGTKESPRRSGCGCCIAP